MLHLQMMSELGRTSKIKQRANVSGIARSCVRIIMVMSERCPACGALLTNGYLSF